MEKAYLNFTTKEIGKDKKFSVECENKQQAEELGSDINSFTSVYRVTISKTKHKKDERTLITIDDCKNGKF